MTVSGGSRDYVIFIDGSSRGNPGRAGCGVVIQDQQGTTVLEEGFPLGHMTNNEAEYSALIVALEEALILHAERVTVYADSELIVRQMNGQYRVKKPELRVLNARANRLAAGLAQFTIAHVGREKNQIADRLAQEASRKAPTQGRSRAERPDSSGPASDSLF